MHQNRFWSDGDSSELCPFAVPHLCTSSTGISTVSPGCCLLHPLSPQDNFLSCYSTQSRSEKSE